MMNNVAVIGAAGHVGLPFSLVVADTEHFVYGVDVNEALVSLLNGGVIPYREEGAAEVLSRVQKAGKILFTPDSTCITDCGVIAIMIGTPVDEEGNPRLDSITDFVKFELCPLLKKGQLVILRSTVSPGTSEILIKMIETETDYIEGVDFYLTFCPERVAQGVGIKESKEFPQIIGANKLISYIVAEKFFDSIGVKTCHFLTTKEAEFGKLITNMYRYVNFALANEFYMIADKQGINCSKVIEAVNDGYPRLNIPKPGPNVSGPCLYKDGKFLLTDIPYSDLIQTSFNINEGMPDYIFNRLKPMIPCQGINIAIWGATFKAESDDIRNSLSYKMRKVCNKNGVNSDIFDPYINIGNVSYAKNADAIIIMTPHKIFREEFEKILPKLHDETIICDIWNLLDGSKHLTTNGFAKAILYKQGI